MKRLAVITVGKTHSGKTTFARRLEKVLHNSIVMDQDNHAAFINIYYQELQPKQGPNMLKHALSKLIVDYTKAHTDYHLIICNSNRSRGSRKYLLEELFTKEEFTRILVHFDIADEVLEKRVQESQRNTNIFRAASSFEEVLTRQQAETFTGNVSNPAEGEANYLFTIKDSHEAGHVIREIVHIAESIKNVVDG